MAGERERERERERRERRDPGKKFLGQWREKDEITGRKGNNKL